MTESELFNVARKLSAEERETYLSNACAGNPDLRVRVEELLRAHSEIEVTIDSNVTLDSNLPIAALHGPDFDVGETRTSDSRNSYDAYKHNQNMIPGASIGPYRLLQNLGCGGMGEVWKAEQLEPVKRQVAVKVIKAGFGSKEILARFEAERQALAMMDHPNIARILDAGTTSAGQPFFAMELVQGMPLTAYCDEKKLSINERLQLFIDICHGVQHAHQKGIIHRDLKPRNILVTVIDGKAVPKVIDFGLAKAMESTQQLTDLSLFTGVGQILGTLKYMSPEQASLDSLDIDTRTDIYALGVVLYELLTGSTPLDDVSISEQGALKILEIIREREAVKPSSKLGNSKAAQLSAITDQRKTDSNRLNRVLVGDLDWIVLKALEKDRTRRYETVSDFAADIRRYLENEPVAARPPSLNYRVRKFVRKNRVAVTAAGLVSLALVGGILATSLAMIRAWEAETTANDRLLEANQARKMADTQAVRAENLARAEKLANEESQSRLKQVERGNDLLFSIFKDIDIHQIREEGRTVENALAERLVAVSEQFERSAIRDRKTEAELLHRLGISLYGLGAYADARNLFERAIAIRKQELGLTNPETLESMRFLAAAMRADGNDDDSLQLAQETLELQQQVLPHDAPQVLATLNEIAIHLSNQGKYAEATELIRRIVKGTEKSLGPEHQDTLMAKSNLADATRSGGDLPESLQLHREVLQVRQKVLGASHIQTIRSNNQVASLLLLTGKVAEAITELRKNYAIAQESFGSEHPDTVKAMGFLAMALDAGGKQDEAISLNRQVLKSLSLRKGPDDSDTLAATANLATALERKGEHVEAERLFRDVFDRRTKLLGEDHPLTLTVLGNLASMLSKVGRPADALPILEKHLAASSRVQGQDHPLTSVARVNLAVAYHKLKRFAEAESNATEAVDSLLKTLGEDHAYTKQAQAVLAAAYRATGQVAKAIPIYESSLNYFRKTKGEKHPETLQQMNNFAAALKDGGEIDRAINIWREAISGMEEVLGPDHAQTLISVANLGATCKASGRLQEARPFLQRAYEASDRVPPLAPIGFHLLEVLAKLGDREETLRLGEKLLTRDRKAHDSSSDMFRAVILKIAVNYSIVEADAQAELLFREYLATATEAQRKSPDYLAAQLDLGLTLVRQGQLQPGEPILDACIGYLRTRSDNSLLLKEDNIMQALDRLIDFYSLFEDPAWASQYRELRNGDFMSKGTLE